MAKRKLVKKEAAENVNSRQPFVIQEINQVNVDRTPKDVSNLRHALRTAENISYPNRSRLLDLYADVDLDGHWTGVWSKRVKSSTKRKIVFQDGSGRKVDELDTLIASKEFRDLQKLILNSIAWGVTGSQFIPGKKFCWEEIPMKHILIEKGQIKINQNDQDGYPYQEDPFIMVYGEKKNLGLLLKVSFYALIKKGNFADWAQYSEIFGQPIRVVYYDAFDDKTRIQLKQVLDESGSSLALMIPKQAKFEIMDGKTSNGNGDLQNKLKIACNNEISTIVLGNTETTSSDNGGSNAKAVIQDEGEDDIKDDDFKDMLSYLNSEKFLNILATYGYPVAGGSFVEYTEADPYKAAAIVNTIVTVRNSGTPVSDDYVYEVTGIPKPDNYEQLKAEIQAEKMAFKAALNPGKSEDKKENNDDDPEDLTDNIVNRIRTKLAAFFDPAP